MERDAAGNIKLRSPDKTAAREQAIEAPWVVKQDNQQKPPGVMVHVPGRRTVVFEPLPPLKTLPPPIEG